MTTPGNLIHETSTSAGDSGPIVLEGAVTGGQNARVPFSEHYANGTQFFVLRTDDTDYEGLICTLDIGGGPSGKDQLTVDSVEYSSNSGARVVWSSNVKDVYGSIIAEQLMYPDNALSELVTAGQRAAAVDNLEALDKNENLAELASATAARSNLGLGDMAVESVSTYVKRDGTQAMTGQLPLVGNPVAAADAARKQYVDDQAALKVSKAGDTMTGALTLPGDPTSALQATTKQYVDAAAGVGITVRESDGSPSVGGVSLISFVRADGFIVSDQGAGEVQIDFDQGQFASTSHNHDSDYEPLWASGGSGARIIVVSNNLPHGGWAYLTGYDDRFLILDDNDFTQGGDTGIDWRDALQSISVQSGSGATVCNFASTTSFRPKYQHARVCRKT